MSIRTGLGVLRRLQPIFTRQIRKASGPTQDPSWPVPRLAGTFVYRRENRNVPKLQKLGAEVIGAFLWFWIIWHFYYDHHHVTGHHTYPDPSAWSDEELGVPCDSDEDPCVKPTPPCTSK